MHQFWARHPKTGKATSDETWYMIIKHILLHPLQMVSAEMSPQK